MFFDLRHGQSVPEPKCVPAALSLKTIDQHSALGPPTKFRIFFQVTYAVSSLFLTLTKTGGVYPISSQFGAPAIDYHQADGMWNLGSFGEAA